MHAQIPVLVAILAVAHAGLLDEGSLGSGSGNSGGISNYGGEKEIFVDFYSPPKYEFKYVVDYPKTGDRKEQTESRIDDLTKSRYSYGEKDRKIEVDRIIKGNVPVKVVGKY